MSDDTADPPDDASERTDGGVGTRDAPADAGSGTDAPLSVPLPRAEYLYAALVVNTELALLGLYLLVTDVGVSEPRYLVYGLVWVNVALLAVRKTDVPPAGRSTRRRAAAVGVGYFALLAVFGGLVSGGVGADATGFRVALLPPGWGPALLYSGYHANVTLMPAYVAGYLALAYMVYATAVDAAGSAAAGVLGLFSCVSCSWPVLAAVASTVLGGGSLLAASALSLSYDLSTATFLLTVGLLYWRPGFGLVAGGD